MDGDSTRSYFTMRGGGKERGKGKGRGEERKSEQSLVVHRGGMGGRRGRVEE